MIDVLGYFGAFVMMTCLLPQIVKTVREGHANGLSAAYAIMAEIGMICLLVYVILTSKAMPLIANYLINSIGFLVLLKYKFFPRK